MSRARLIEDMAAAWIIRRENGDWSEVDQAKLDAWLHESDGNKVAYWRLQHSWREANRIRSLGIRAKGISAPSRFSRYWKAAAIAASLVLMVGFGANMHREGAPVPQIAAAQYETPVGGYRTVSLADGSKVELNTKTVVRAAVTTRQRKIWLESGEAFFEVAHDPKHPFVVYAGPKTVTVLGTKFSVRRDGNKVTISVLEGRVRISDDTGTSATNTTSATITGGVMAISQGSSTLVTERSVNRVENALAWRAGMLNFDQERLADVVDEFNRYNSRGLVVTDAEAADMRIGGTFQASNVDAFVRLLRDAYGLKIVNEAGVVKISS